MKPLRLFRVAIMVVFMVAKPTGHNSRSTGSEAGSTIANLIGMIAKKPRKKHALHTQAATSAQGTSHSDQTHAFHSDGSSSGKAPKDNSTPGAARPPARNSIKAAKTKQRVVGNKSNKKVRPVRPRRVPTSFSRTFHHEGAFDQGLDSLQEGLGLSKSRVTSYCHDSEPIVAKPTSVCASSLIYAPDMDGQADPGEVVWIQEPSTDDSGQERAVVILGHHAQRILALLISTNTDHATQDNWLDIGSGGWDRQGRQAWVRLDKTLEVPEHMIRRRGTIMPRRRFERIAARLRSDYNWL